MEKQLIVNADDLGLSEGANAAILELLREGAVTSASLMAPGRTVEAAAEACVRQGLGSIGVHLTLTGVGQLRLAPVYRSRDLRTLTDEEGFFHRNAGVLERTADPEEVRLELDAQIRAVLDLGVKPSHLDSHEGSVLGLATGRDYLDIVLELCEVYGLPFLLPAGMAEHPLFDAGDRARFAARIAAARARGIPLIDGIISLPYRLESGVDYAGAKRRMLGLLQEVKPGITQWTVHPSLPSGEPEEEAGREREWEYRLVQDPEVRGALLQAGVRLISWRDVRESARQF
ncbi:ChbG/HpnK family deacetylase [Gorillibacterium sp. sgz5001074]|uniref:ChbG/HpnK family deacetylase n=1 Tax=Gorillibacterium sp. sgz5001074 TaxID=3446695 RepID=UPI003F681136